MNAEGVRMLTTAVVLRAILDYRRAWGREDRRALQELERFFAAHGSTPSTRFRR